MSKLYGNPWFQVPKPVPNAAIRLFCFPYAGGSASIYDGWGERLADDIEVVAVQYPGRGSRFREPLISRCDNLVTALLREVSPLADKPFAFFGHSNGGLVSYELARALQRHGTSRQVHHFISGHRPIHLARNHQPMHDLPDAAFIDKLAALGGTPRELLESRELLDLFLPVLRADFAISETYAFPGGPLLRGDMSVLYGRDDVDVAEADVMRWAELIDGTIDLHRFDGGHFFVNSCKQRVIDFVANRLRSLPARSMRSRQVA